MRTKTESHCVELARSSQSAAALLTTIHQPLTTLQIARRAGVNLDRTSYLIGTLDSRRLLKCLNPKAHKSRLYWLTQQGTRCQSWFRRQNGLARLTHDFPQVDWDLYGWLCHRHRTAVVKAMREPLHPVTIRKRARKSNDKLRMSANNVRDVIKLLMERGIAQRILHDRESRPRYQLSPLGQDMQRLLLRVHRPIEQVWRPSQ